MLHRCAHGTSGITGRREHSSSAGGRRSPQGQRNGGRDGPWQGDVAETGLRRIAARRSEESYGDDRPNRAHSRRELPEVKSHGKAWKAGRKSPGARSAEPWLLSTCSAIAWPPQPHRRRPERFAAVAERLPGPGHRGSVHPESVHAAADRVRTLQPHETGRDARRRGDQPAHSGLRGREPPLQRKQLRLQPGGH